FNWDAGRDVTTLRVGYIKSAFEADRENKTAKANDEASLEVLRRLDIKPVPVELPSAYLVEAISFILNTEAAAAFADLATSNRDDLMVRQERNAWPNVFRFARFTPAVEYLQANRIRTLIMQEMAKLFETIDVYITPSLVGNGLLLTNLTGHPCVVVPNGFDDKRAPTSLSFVGNLYAEAETLLLARVFQQATDFHLKHPAL
ncbi:MAG: amidase, partial [candidate division Zixibacteria bacterium]|nr:amidase [candidate division Zixibacteria bacterium]